MADEDKLTGGSIARDNIDARKAAPVPLQLSSEDRAIISRVAKIAGMELTDLEALLVSEDRLNQLKDAVKPLLEEEGRASIEWKNQGERVKVDKLPCSEAREDKRIWCQAGTRRRPSVTTRCFGYWVMTRVTEPHRTGGRSHRSRLNRGEEHRCVEQTSICPQLPVIVPF
jgi:hypothetical protein